MVKKPYPLPDLLHCPLSHQRGRIDGILLEVLVRRITKSEHITRSMDMEDVTQVSLEKSNHADGLSAKLEPSSSNMVNLDEVGLLIEGSEVVEVMARKRSSTSVGGAVRGESDPLEVPNYLKTQPSDIKTVRRIGNAGATTKVY